MSALNARHLNAKETCAPQELTFRSAAMALATCGWMRIALSLELLLQDCPLRRARPKRWPADIRSAAFLQGVFIMQCSGPSPLVQAWLRLLRCRSRKSCVA